MSSPAAAAPQAAPAGVLDLVQVADVSGLSVSPGGRLLAFRVERARLDTNTYASDWYVLDLARGSTRPIGSGGDAIYRDPGVSEGEKPVWSGDARSLFYRALVDGAVQLWRAEADGSGARAVLQEDGDIRALRLADDGKALLVDVGPSRDAVRFAEQREYDDGILVDQTVELGQNVFRGAIINGRHASQRLTGNWFVRTGLLSSEPPRERRLDLTTMKVSDVAGGTPAAERELPRVLSETMSQSFEFSAGRIAVADWNFKHEVGTLTLQPGGGTAPISCSDPACTRNRIVWAAWQPDGKELVFTTRHEGVQALFVWTPAANKVRMVVQTDGQLSGSRDAGVPCAIADTAAICVAAEAASPPRIERIDLVSGARSTLFDPNVGLRERVPAAEHLSWTGKEGHSYSGWLFMPANRAGRVPLFVTYYTCEGFLRGGLGDEWPLAPLSEAGIAALCINKASASVEDALSNYQAGLEGVEAAVQLLDRRGVIDPRRVGMGGLSFGTEVTMWTAMRSSLLAAASITSVEFEPTYYWMNGVRGRDNHAVVESYWKLKAPDETPDRWKLLSPALNTDRIRAPLLMQMPEQEARENIELYSRLSNSTTPVELYVFPDEPHVKFLPRHKLAAYQRNLDWFRYWLQGYMDPDPLKAEQYRRWGELARRRGAVQ